MHLSRVNNHRLEYRPAQPARSGPRETVVSGTARFADLMRVQIGPEPGPEGTTGSTAFRNHPTPFDAAVPAAASEVLSARAGAGLVTESGAPKIVLGQQYPGYRGPAATNPYFGSQLCEGNVAGFQNWFQSIEIGGLGAFTWPPAFSATPEAAQEALRLVQQYVPDAKIEAYVYNSQIGSTPSHAIVLPNGERMNAGLLLDAYYHQGSGVDSNSDAFLRAEIGWLTGTQPVGPEVG